MKKFKRIISEKIKQRDSLSVQSLLFLLTGIYGILLVIYAMPYVSFSILLVFPVITLFCIILYVLFYIHKRWFWIGLISILVLCSVFVVIQWNQITEQIFVLFRSLTDRTIQKEENITVAVLLILTMISICFFLLEIVWNYHWLPYMLVTGFMVGAPFFGIPIGIVPVMLGLIFQILFWTMHTVDRQTSVQMSDPKRKHSLFTRCSIFMVAVLFTLVCVSVIITSIWGTELSNTVYSVEGFISRSMQRITGKAKDTIADGHVSNGNNYRAGEIQLEVIALEQPTEVLYLKGFSGGEYIGGEWEPADEQAVFHEMALALHWEEWESWIRGLYYNLYFGMNQASTENLSGPRTLFLRHVSETYDTIYSPYYSGWIDWGDSMKWGYIFDYYEESEINIDWENVPDHFEMMRDWYQQVQTAYIQEIPNAYTQVPGEMLPRLTELCRDNPLDSLDQVTAFILTILQFNVSYTLTPGRAPFNQDIVEYFLFDNHEGYCVHFASAATLMYRLYGIPARYASGYAVEPSAFVQQENGRWKAEVTDESAHAWTEIFLEDYGWTPVEVTPSADGEMSATYPGFDVEDLSQILKIEELNLDRISVIKRDETDRQESSDLTVENFTWNIDFSKYKKWMPAIGVFFVYTLCLVPFFLNYRRMCHLEKLQTMSCRRIFSKWIEMLHFCGFLLRYEGMEEDLSEQAAKIVPEITVDEVKRMLEIVSSAAYGSETTGIEADAFVREIYFRSSSCLKRQLKGRKKWSFQYWHNYG